MSFSGHRESHRPKAERQASINRREGTRSRYARCPGCRKLRLKMIPNNNQRPHKKGWRRLVDGGPKVCHVCVDKAQKGTT